ncbi:hypothetical protein BVX98_06320, partial [bacterium F11]
KGKVTDDGKPNPPGELVTEWTVITSTPLNGIEIYKPDSISLMAIAHSPGRYLLELRAFDGEFTSRDRVSLTVEASTPTPQNLPPVVDAGLDKEVLQLKAVLLEGKVSDDGLPNPPGRVDVRWSVHSSSTGKENNEVIISSPTQETTKAWFSSPGEYTLKLEATDGELTAYDTIIIKVRGDTVFTPLPIRDEGQIVDGSDTRVRQGRPAKVFYGLNKPGHFEVRIFGRKGRLLKRLINDYRDIGHQQIQWNGRDELGRKYPRGPYLAKIFLNGQLVKKFHFMLLN